MMFEVAFVVGVFCVWLYTGNDQARQAFLLALVIEVARFFYKFTLHRRRWAKMVYVLQSFHSFPAGPASFVLLGTYQDFR